MDFLFLFTLGCMNIVLGKIKWIFFFLLFFYTYRYTDLPFSFSVAHKSHNPSLYLLRENQIVAIICQFDSFRNGDCSI